jgi:glucosamine 6-phosphate synthetase-like amidotransferase/phosphosugar isomerase protein
MYEYILESNGVIRNIITKRGPALRESVEYVLSRKVEQIYMIGSGTSYHAEYAAKCFMEKILRVPVRVFYPLQFIDECAAVSRDTLVVGASHGGQSSSTIAGLDRAREMGLPTIASSAVPDSEIMKHGDAVLTCELGEENAGPKTKGYFCAIVLYILFALEIAVRKNLISASDAATYIARLQKTADNIPVIAERSSAWYDAQAEELKTARRIVLIGYGNNRATYMEGTLKILEAVRFGITGYEMEEFMHGIYHSIWKDDFVFYIGSPGKYYPRIIQLQKYFEERTAHNFLFSSDVAQNNGKNFIAPFIDDEDFSPLEYIVPLQVIARRLSADLGIDCNIPSDPDFHRKMQSYRYSDSPLRLFQNPAKGGTATGCRVSPFAPVFALRYPPLRGSDPRNAPETPEAGKARDRITAAACVPQGF